MELGNNKGSDGVLAYIYIYIWFLFFCVRFVCYLGLLFSSFFVDSASYCVFRFWGFSQGCWSRGGGGEVAANMENSQSVGG